MYKHPIDYLKPVRVTDPILFLRVLPGSGAHDEWGFRNLTVPSEVDVVALGDSNTWGVNATWEKNWPGWYSRLSGKSIYNFGISAFGPAESLYFLKTKALELDPKLIVLALHPGNDFSDAYRTVSRSPYWASYRTDSMPPYKRADDSKFEPSAIDAPADGELILQFRYWLRRNSILFRIIEEGPVGQKINAWGDQREGFGRHGCIVKTTDPFETVFNPEGTFSLIDPDRVEVREGFDLTLEFIKEMAEVAAENGTDFLVVFIPTKESVMVSWVDKAENGCNAFVKKVAETEKRLGDRARLFFQKNDIDYVDSLEMLQAKLPQQRLYIRSGDSHPTEDGYRVIAEQILHATQPKSSD